MTISEFAARKNQVEPPAAGRAIALLMRLSIRELVLSRKTIALLLISGLLVGSCIIISLVTRIGLLKGPSVSEAFGFLVTEAFLRFLLPIFSLFYGAAIVTDEVDGRTLNYLITRPIRRPVILLGKFLGFVVVTTIMLLVTLVLCWLAVLAGSGPALLLKELPILLADGVMVVFGILSYGALFTLSGAWLRKPAVPMLVYIFLWEHAVSFLPGNVQRLTILHFLESLTSHSMASSGIFSFLSAFRLHESYLVSLLALTIVTAAALFLASRVFATKEYRLEK